MGLVEPLNSRFAEHHYGVLWRNTNRRSDEADPEKIEHSGNLLVDLLVGAQCHLVGRIPYLTGLLPRMQRLQRELAKDSGGERKAYLMPKGVVGKGGAASSLRRVHYGVMFIPRSGFDVAANTCIFLLCTTCRTLSFLFLPPLPPPI